MKLPCFIAIRGEFLCTSRIQCADFCAGATHKKFEVNDSKFFDLLLPAIRHNKTNNIYGYGIKLYK